MAKSEQPPAGDKVMLGISADLSLSDEFARRLADLRLELEVEIFVDKRLAGPNAWYIAHEAT